MDDIYMLADATSIIDEVCEATSHWESIAKDCGVPDSVIDKIKRNLI